MCTPSSCRDATFRSVATLNNPAHLQTDPTFHHHGLRHQHGGFSLAISWWASHDPRDAKLGEAGRKVVVDFRPVDVTLDDYNNGSVHVSCPPRSHEYFVQSTGERLMTPCLCNSTKFWLNCRQLEHLKPALRERTHTRHIARPR